MTASQILSGTPTHVWALLAGLAVLGALQMRERLARPIRVAAVPLVLLGWSVAGAGASFAWHPAALVAWACGLALALLAGRALLAASPVPIARWLPAEARFRIRGSAWPLVLLLSLFLAKYAAGVLLAIEPQAAHATAVAAGFGFAFGAFAGAFASRNLAVWRTRRAAPAALAGALGGEAR
jgi:hypothetical protein